MSDKVIRIVDPERRTADAVQPRDPAQADVIILPTRLPEQIKPERILEVA